MQVLFQVNRYVGARAYIAYIATYTNLTKSRLLIDRSILLLLNASKCSVRRNSPEAECGERTRLCVLGQIRASISIIMAIVKSAVFDHVAASDAGDLCACVPPPPHPPLAPARANSVAASNFQTSQRDNQFEPHLHQQQLIGRRDGAKGALINEPCRLDCRSALPHAGCGCSTQWRCQLHAQPQFTTRRHTSEPLQIMNFFLRTHSGTHSAHDAINELQVSGRILTSSAQTDRHSPKRLAAACLPLPCASRSATSHNWRGFAASLSLSHEPLVVVAGGYFDALARSLERGRQALCMRARALR